MSNVIRPPVFEKGYPSYEAVNRDTDLDGGVPLKKDWVKESNDSTQKINEKN